jgi:hypothetical protein
MPFVSGPEKRPYVGEMRFTAQLFRPIFAQLDTHHDIWAVRLGIYLTWQWRMRAHQANWEQTWNVGTLLDGARLPQEDRNRERIREQFEGSLDALQRIEAIAGWEYVWPEGENLEEQLPRRNWFAQWREWKVLILPPDWVKGHYASIAPRKVKAIEQQNRARKASPKKAPKQKSEGETEAD